jgi:hypothetical protein
MHKNLLIAIALVGFSLDGLSQSKPKEEPYNILWLSCEDIDHNLAAFPEYREQLLKMRKQLADWQLKVHDKGLIDEYNLVQLFWPGLIQPATEQVVVNEEKGLVSLSCATEGSSIGYQLDDQIGYKISEPVDFQL